MGKKIILTHAAIPANMNITPKKDDKGYYYVTLGAVGIPNSIGEIYLADGAVEQLASDQHPIGRYLKGGYLKGEANHPQFEGKVHTRESYFIRLQKIDLTNVSHHIRSVELISTTLADGTPAVLFKGWVKPVGPYGQYLEESLNNTEENTAFSIRSIVDSFMMNGVSYRKFNMIITFDWIPKPGISVANKYSDAGIGVEDNGVFIDANQMEYSKDEIMNIINSTIDVSSGNEDDGFDKEYNLKHVVNYEPITAIDKIKNWGKV